MCTAIIFEQKCNFLGRTLDLEYHYDEEVVITPRGHTFSRKKSSDFKIDFAIIGIATVKDSYPLYYDAVNEHGLAIAGLNFVGNAKFSKNKKDNFISLSQFELIPFILGKCKTLKAAKDLLENTCLIDTPFDVSMPVSELHYFISDGKQSLAAEPTEQGFNIYDDPFGVLTNNPPFPYHKDNINNYMNLSQNEAENKFGANLPLKPYSRGMGAFGMPGDLSSSSRFIRAAFGVANATKKDSESRSVSQVFHILETVNQTEGLVKIGDLYERTQYSICANLDTGTYYYKTYNNSRITAVKLTKEAKEASSLSRFPLKTEEDILFENN